MQLPKIKSVTAIKRYLLHVVFTNGTEGDYDMSHLAGKGVFKTWGIDDNFYKVFINPDQVLFPGMTIWILIRLMFIVQ